MTVIKGKEKQNVGSKNTEKLNGFSAYAATGIIGRWILLTRSPLFGGAVQPDHESLRVTRPTERILCNGVAIVEQCEVILRDPKAWKEPWGAWILGSLVALRLDGLANKRWGKNNNSCLLTLWWHYICSSHFFRHRF